MGRMTRRALLGSAAFAAAGAAAYGGARFACSFVPRNHAGFFSLLDVAPEGEAARRIGRLALALDGAPQDLGAFARALGERPLLREAMATDCPKSRARLVQDQCADDFSAGRSVLIDGWVLSETEARICAARLISSAV